MSSPAAALHSNAEARSLVFGCSLLVLTLSVLDLVGWWAHIPLLTSVFPGYATMKPNTALCLGLLALAFLLEARRGRPAWSQVAAAGAAGLSLLVSGLSSLEYLTGRNFSIDQLIARVQADRFYDPAGRMSHGTAFCLVLTAAAFLLRDRWYKAAVALTLAALVASVSGLVGFAFQVGPLAEVPWLRSLAVHTATGLTLLQIALLASRPAHEPYRTLGLSARTEGGRRYFLLAVTLVPILLAFPVAAGLRHGYYDAAFALALLVVLLIVLQTALLWADSRTILRGQMELRRSEAHSSRILQSIGDGVIVTDLEGRITRMNPIAETLTGWTLTEAAGAPLVEVFRIYNEHSRKLVENPVHEVRRRGTIVGLANHTMLRRRDGTETHIEDSAAPIADETGLLTGVVLVFRSVDERKQAERDLRAADERLQIALTTAQLGAWELDLSTMEMTSSPSCRANFGRSAAEPFTYPDLLASVHPDDLDAMQAALRQSIDQHEVYRAEYRVLWPDGSLHYLVASGRTLYDDAERPVRLVGVTLDVTQRHLAASALIQSEKLAVVGRLASSIAHEINNPLESVTNLVFLARQHAVDPQAKSYLDDAERELRRVSAISHQTLRFYKQSTKPRSVDMSDLIDNVLSVYQGKLLNSKVSVECRFRSHQPVFCFDDEIRQVLSNLVGNAIDAMLGTPGRLLLRTRQTSTSALGSPGLVTTVADTGSGIAKSTLQKIFEPFFSTKGLSGTGLGLWISDEIVRRHGGTMRVRSRQGPGPSGTVFTLFLPFDAVARNADEAKQDTQRGNRAGAKEPVAATAPSSLELTLPARSPQL